MVPPEQNAQEHYDKGGKFEWSEFNAVNQDLLDCRPEDSLGIDLDRPIRGTPKIVTRALLLVEQSNTRFSVWGFKDPCTTLTYASWRSFLPAHRIIAIYRNLEEISLHYARQKAKNPDLSWRHWAFYNTCILHYLDMGTEPCILVNFEALFSDGREWARLENFIGRSLVDVRDASLHRCRIRKSDVSFGLRHGIDCAAIWQRLENRRGQQPS
jgi:hypothetical protein